MSSPSGAVSDDLRVFISYRHSDCQSQANGLHDGLVLRLPHASIFKDIDSIPFGVDFEDHIREEIRRCDVVLVLIGEDWLDARDAAGTRRLDLAEDFVRLEIETAMATPSVQVVPVLVEGATMPRQADLPESIQRLARLNAIHLSDARWRSDLALLTDTVQQLGERRDPGPRRNPGHRKRRLPVLLTLAGVSVLAGLGVAAWALTNRVEPEVTKPAGAAPSMAPSPVLMPDLYGLARNEGDKTLRAALAEVARRGGNDPVDYQRRQLGYQVAYSDGFWDAGVEAIWSQFPPPGTPLELGMNVTIVQWDKKYCDAVPAEHDLRGNWCYEQPPTPKVMTAYYDRH